MVPQVNTASFIFILLQKSRMPSFWQVMMGQVFLGVEPLIALSNRGL